MLAQQFNFLAVSVVTKSPHPFRSEPRSDGLERHATLLAQRVSTHLFTHSPSVLFFPGVSYLSCGGRAAGALSIAATGRLSP